MRGKIAKKLRNYVLELNATREPEPTEQDIKRAYRKAKTLWKTDQRFKKAFSLHFQGKLGFDPMVKT